MKSDAQQHYREPADWQRTVTAGVFAAASLVILWPLHHLGLLTRPIALELRVVQVVITATMTAVVYLRRRTVSEAFCAVAFTVIVSPFLLIFWHEEHWLAAGGRSGVAWTPFVAHKHVLILTAVFCPRPRWLAPAIMATFALEALVLWLKLDLGSPSANVAAGEPLFVATVLAFLLYAYRVHHEDRDRELVRLRADATALRTINEAFVAVRDMANTPLQSLELTLSLIDGGDPPRGLIVKGKRALVRLRQLNALLPVAEVNKATIDTAVLDDVRRRIALDPELSGDRRDRRPSASGRSKRK